MRIVTLPSIKILLKASPIGKAEIFFSLIFTTALVVGYLLSTYERIDITPISKGSVLVYTCGSLVTWSIVFFGLIATKRWCLRKHNTHQVAFLEGFSDRKLWLTTSLIIFACYLPIILLCLSVLSPDSWSSIRQATGEATLTSAHPIIFTAFVGIFIRIGLLFGSLELGALLFSLVQSAILAMIFARIIVWMRQEKINRNGIVAALFFYAILPVNAIAGIIMWKDILFAGFGLLLLMVMRQLYVKKDEFFTNKNVFYFILLAFLFCAWRNNGFYAYVLFSVLVTVINRNTFFKTKYLLVLFLPILLFIIYSALSSLIAKPAPLDESMSVPLQQVARTVKYHGDSLSDEDRSTINKVLPYAHLGKLYNPNLSDPVKSSFNEKAFKEDKIKYTKLWLKLSEEHKKTYAAAFFYNSYGYVYPFYPSSTTTDTLLDNDTPYNAVAGYVDDAYAHGTKPAVAKYQDFITSLLPALHNIGFYTCVILLSMYVAIIRRRRELVGVFIILLCLFVTTILGPVNGEFRYLYLFVISTPFILGSVFNSERDKVHRNG
jgi:hypothetical protein